MDSEELKSLKKKARFMIKNIWDGLEQSDVDGFLNNFEDNEKVGYILLDMLIYYSYAQEEMIIENLIRLFERDLWISGIIGKKEESADEINEKMKEMYRVTCFVPVKDSSPADSSFTLSGNYKKNKRISKLANFIDVTAIPIEIVFEKKIIVFYDDIIGTGTQFKKFYEEKRDFGGVKASLKEIAKKRSDIKFYYLVLAGYKDSVDELEKNNPELKIIVSELFSRDYDIYDDENEYWEYKEDIKAEVIEYIDNKKELLSFNDKFCLNLPVLFQRSRANNTSLFLYWLEKNNEKVNWCPLYRR